MKSYCLHDFDQGSATWDGLKAPETSSAGRWGYDGEKIDNATTDFH